MDGPSDGSDKKSPATSAIIELPKVLRNICEELVSKQDLLNMALSCKAIKAVALPMMWIFPLLSSMTPLLAPLRRDGFVASEGKLLLSRALNRQHSAWSEFYRDTSRVREIKADERFFSDIHHGTMFQLMQFMGDRPMFPNLRKLTLSGDDSSYNPGTVISDLPVFISPMLKDIDITVSSNSQDRLAETCAPLLDSFFSIIQERNAPVERLSLDAKIALSLASLRLISTIARANTLRYLCIQGISCLDEDTTSWVKDLGQLDALEELDIDIREDTRGRQPILQEPSTSHKSQRQKEGKSAEKGLIDMGIEPGPPEPKAVPRYPRLKTLKLKGPRRIAKAFTRCLASNRLTQLTLKPQATGRVTSIEDICSCLSDLNRNFYLHESIQRITFEAGLITHNWRYPPQVPTILLSDPISKCGQLRYIELRNALEDTDKFVHLVAPHLPRLRECSIALDSEPADITALHFFASACPDLIRLQIPIRSEKFPDLDFTIIPQKHHLRHLTPSDLNNCSSFNNQDLSRAVRHLNASFPHLTSMGGASAWQSVWTMMKTIQDIAQRG